MTKLQEAYQTLRDGGIGHREAVDRLAVTLGVDWGTVSRSLNRAKKARA